MRAYDADRPTAHDTCNLWVFCTREGQPNQSLAWYPGIRNPRKVYKQAKTLDEYGITNTVFYSSHAQRYKTHISKGGKRTDMRIQKNRVRPSLNIELAIGVQEKRKRKKRRSEERYEKEMK